MRLWFAFILLLFVTQQNFAQKSGKAKLQAMYDAIKSADIKYPVIVMAQCMQETGSLSCKKCCYRYHNLFGFYLKGNKCKKFESDSACIAYYKKWQDKRLPAWSKKNPKGTYYDFLHKMGYATGAKYTKEVKPHVIWIEKNLKL